MPAVRQPERTPWPLRHKGPCGRRVHCWRPACRAEFGEYLTVEVLDDGSAVAFCHHYRHPVTDPLLRQVA